MVDTNSHHRIVLVLIGIIVYENAICVATAVHLTTRAGPSVDEDRGCPSDVIMEMTRDSEDVISHVLHITTLPRVHELYNEETERVMHDESCEYMYESSDGDESSVLGYSMSHHQHPVWHGSIHTHTADYIITDQSTRSKFYTILEATQIHRNSPLKQERNRARSRRSSGDQANTDMLHVTMACVIDAHMYDRWWDLSDRDHNTTVANIRYHLTHVTMEMNALLSTLEGIDLAVTLSRVHIATDLDQSPSPATDTLEMFNTWVGNNGAMFDDVDHVMGFTGTEMYNEVGSPVIGNSYRGSICGSSWKSSVVRDHTIYTTAVVAAHQIARSLKAAYDGDGNSCESTGDVMSPEIVVPPYNIIHRQTTEFSECSAQDIAEHVDKLQTRGVNCMVSHEAPLPARPHDHDAALLPGEVYTIDQQCRIAVNNDSYYCAERTTSVDGSDGVAGKCATLECTQDFTDLGNVDCYVSFANQLYDGTICGDNKWCMDGACVDIPTTDIPTTMATERDVSRSTADADITTEADDKLYTGTEQGSTRSTAYGDVAETTGTVTEGTTSTDEAADLPSTSRTSSDVHITSTEDTEYFTGSTVTGDATHTQEHTSTDASTVPGVNSRSLKTYIKLSGSFDENLGDESSAEYQQLTQDLDESISSIFSEEFKEDFIGLENFKYKPGSIIAEYDTVVRTNSTLTGEDLVSTLQSSVDNNNGKLPGLDHYTVLDITVTEPEFVTGDGEDGDDSNDSMAIVIAVVVIGGGGLVVLCVVICVCYKMRKPSSTLKKQSADYTSTSSLTLDGKRSKSGTMTSSLSKSYDDITIQPYSPYQSSQPRDTSIPLYMSSTATAMPAGVTATQQQMYGGDTSEGGCVSVVHVEGESEAGGAAEGAPGAPGAQVLYVDGSSSSVVGADTAEEIKM